MKLSILTAVTILAGCDELTMISPSPGSGIYASPGEERYEVSTTGPTPLNIRASAGGLCLMFWKPYEQRSPAFTELRGQECANRTFGDLDWVARIPNGRRGFVLILPPGASRRRLDKSLRLTMID